MGEVRGALPVQLTSFIGRTRELSEVVDLLSADRLVTLTGPGGSGKTRLALEAVGDGAVEHLGAATFVDLSVVDDPSAVERAVAECVPASAPTVAAIASAVGDARVVLVLDNCEHVLAASATLVDRLLRACPALSVLATSREPLGVAGEVTYAVPPLDDGDAALLFLDRARRARPAQPEPSPDVVADICAQLDRLPLAIELAAARARVLSPGQIRDGLRQRFRLLAAGGRTAARRHQTLEASVDWSHDLLRDAERIVFRRLSVFTGGFTMAAAQAVASDAAITPDAVFDLVSQLAEKSLLVLGDERFHVLETVRQYAAARLDDAGETAATLRKHYGFFLELVLDRRDEAEAAYRVRVGADLDNIRRALQWSDGLDDATQFVQLTLALFPYWSSSRWTSEGAECLARAAQRAVDVDPRSRATALQWCGFLTGLSGRWEEAHVVSVEAVELARQREDRRLLVWALGYAALAASNVAAPDADELADEAVRVATEIGDDRGRAFALCQQAFGRLRDHADVAGAVDQLDLAVTLARQTRLHSIERTASAHLAIARVAGGAVADAIGPLEEAAADLRAVSDGFILGDVLSVLTYCRLLAGDDDGADAAIAELASLDGEVPDSAFGNSRMVASWYAQLVRGDWRAATSGLPHQAAAVPLSDSNRFHALGHAAIAACFAGDLDEAERLAARAGQLGVEHGLGPSADYVDALVALHRGDLGRAEARAHAAAATLATPRPAMTTISCLLLHMAVASTRGRPEDAARFLGAACAHAHRVGMATSTPWWKAMEMDTPERLRHDLGDRFDELWTKGRSLSVDDVVSYLRRGRGARSRPSYGWDSLTPTEQQVIALVVEGCTNKVIAERLCMSVGTVKSHLTHVYAKLDVTSRIELSAAYLRRDFAS